MVRAEFYERRVRDFGYYDEKFRSIPFRSKDENMWVIQKHKGYVTGDDITSFNRVDKKKIFYHVGQNKFVEVGPREGNKLPYKKVMTTQEIESVYSVHIPRETKVFLMVWEVHAGWYDCDDPIGLYASFHESAEDWADAVEENTIQKGGFYVRMSLRKAHKLIYEQTNMYTKLIDYPNRVPFKLDGPSISKKLQELGVDFTKICKDLTILDDE